MINLLGSNRVYTVKEIDTIINDKTGIRVVKDLPNAADANPDIVYYKITDKYYQSEDSKLHRVMRPFIVGKDDDGTFIWYTADSNPSSNNNYPEFENLPSINGEKFIGELNEERADAAVSPDGISGGYDLSISDDDIIDIVKNNIDPDETLPIGS